MMVVESCQLEANLNAIAHFLNNISVTNESIYITLEVNRKAKEFLFHGEKLFRHTKYSIRFVPHIAMRESILKGLYDEVGHWDSNSNYRFVRERYWWPNMRSEVTKLAQSCDVCQKAKWANRKELTGKFSISRLFHTWCIDFAGPLPHTNAENQYLILAV